MTSTHGTDGPHIVLGIDYPSRDGNAAEVAARLAERRGLGLRLVHGLSEAPPYVTPMGFSYDPVATAHSARVWLAEKAADIRHVHPAVRVTETVATSPGSKALIAESAHAEMVVIGARGHGGFTRLLIGSTAMQVITHAAAPVLVIRDEVPVEASSPVLVGIDTSPESVEAVSQAFELAEALEAPLIALYAWDVAVLGAMELGNPWPADKEKFLQAMRDTAERQLAEALAGWSEKYPDVVVSHRCPRNTSPARALLEAQRETGAGVIVVGSHGRGGVAGLALGSVSQSVAANAPSSVLVARPRHATH
jgi:nucleotide-binding universal stress UspA family protein